MNKKVFSERFNNELTVNDFPAELADKTKAIAKVFGVSRHFANGMIFGDQLPSVEQLNKIAEVLDVCPQWLCGKAKKKKSFSHREVSDN